jgi:uncharacterized metal-binding protein
MPYGWAVPHRSKFSHSLTIGLPCRFLYALLVVSVLWPSVFDWAISASLQQLVNGEAIAWLLSAPAQSPLDAFWAILKGLVLLPGDLWQFAVSLGDRFLVLLVGAIVGDVVHLLKDGYSLKEML